MAQRSLGVLTLDIVAKTGNFTAGMDKAERASKKASDNIARSTGGATKSVRSLGDQSQQTAGDISQMGAALTRVAGPIAAFLSVQQIGRASEEWTSINNRLRLVTDTSEEFTQAQENIFQIAQASRAPLSATAELYQRIATNAEELRLSGQGVADIVDTISKTMAISGASTESSRAALVQLGQAFASGVLRGEEFNSVMEQAPALAKAIADGMGVAVGQLRGLAQDGKLTADVVVEALQRQAKAVDEQFGQIAPTISSALQTVENSFTRLVGTLDQSLGASSGIATGILSISSAMEGLANNADLVEKALNVAFAVAGGKAAASLVALVKQMQAASAASKLAAGAALQKAAAEEKSAIATLNAVKAEQLKAIEAVKTANAEAAAIKAQQAGEIARLKTVQQAIAAEMALEQVRHKAQITDIGRQQSVARMAELRTAELAITRQMTAAEAALANQTAASTAKVTAALEARRIATINLATAQGALSAATAASSASIASMAAAGSVGAAAMTKAAAAGSRVLSILGGPVGLVVTLGLAAASFIDFGENAEQGFDKAAAAATNAADRVKNLTRSIIATDLNIDIDASSYDSITKAIGDVTAEIEKAEKQLEEYKRIFESDVPQLPGTDQVTQKNVDAAAERVNALRGALMKLQTAQSSTRFSGIDDANKYLDSLVKQNQQLQELSGKEQAIIKLREISIDQDSELGKQILAQAAANDALYESKERNKKATEGLRQAEVKRLDEYRRQRDLFASTEESLRQQIALFDQSGNAASVAYRTAFGDLKNLTDEEKKRLDSMAKAADFLDEQKRKQSELKDVLSSLQTEQERNAESAEKMRETLKSAFEDGKISADQYNEAIKRINDRMNENAEGGYWDKWLESAEKSLMNFDELSRSVIDNFSSGFGNALESIVFDFTTLEDAGKQMLESLLRGTINALGQMAAQWVAYQVVQMLTQRTTQAAAIPALVANASASSLQAGINAYASTAAIPIVGPALAPAAMSTAVAATSPMVASIASLAAMGMAHEGMDSIPKTGTWLLEKGERVTTEKTSAKLDRTLSDVQRKLDRAPANNRPVVQNFNIETPNADSFRMSERQMMRRARQRIS